MNPLVTLALFSYNQEAFIRDAVQGALAQTYHPLEIFISDDCSRDDTFAIIQSVVAAYKGRHRIVLSQNSKNLGVIKHLELVNRRASGEIIVAAAGDDISLPSRVEELVSRFVQNPQCVYAHSAARLIDSQGRVGSLTSSPGVNAFKSAFRAAKAHCLALGATVAWRKSILDDFPAISGKVWAEDLVMGFRAVLAGAVEYIPEALVLYRHDAGITARRVSKYQAHMRNYYVRQQRLKDAFAKKRVLLCASLSFLTALSAVKSGAARLVG